MFLELGGNKRIFKAVKYDVFTKWYVNMLMFKNKQIFPDLFSF